MSPAAPVVAERQHPAIDAYAEAIDSMLASDLGAPRKQRHTAKRIYDRIVEEHGYRGSYSSVQRYVRAWRRARTTGTGDGYLELEWAPGAAQVDFGNFEADIAGERTHLKLLVLTLPHSNARYAVACRSQRSECMCAALSEIFGWIGRAPSVLVLDNATEAGRRVRGEVSEVAPVLAVPRALPGGKPLLQPLFGQREGFRGERRGVPQAQPLGAGALRGLRRGTERPSACGLRSPERGGARPRRAGDQRGACRGHRINARPARRPLRCRALGKRACGQARHRHRGRTRLSGRPGLALARARRRPEGGHRRDPAPTAVAGSRCCPARTGRARR